MIIYDWVFITLIFYIIVLAVHNIRRLKQYEPYLFFGSCVTITFLIGLRHDWPDEGVYIEAFNRAPLAYQFNWSIVEPYGYAEKGYLFLASIIKTFIDNPTVYLILMGGVSMYLLYKSLNKYCIFPMLGLCDYVGRFLLNRDFTQMRSSLAILMVILAIRFIKEKKMWQYLLVVFVAYQFHHMALIGLPLYFLYKLRLNRNSMIVCLALAFVLSQTLAGSIEGGVDQFSEDLQYTTYTEGEYVEQSLGLRNPMIYFQIAILLMFSHFEPQLRKKLVYFDLYRWAYFYSTLILIFFCNYTALSGRTSTMFATVEMFILPYILSELRGFKRYAFLAFMGVVFLYFFWSKLNNAYMMTQGAIFS